MANKRIDQPTGTETVGHEWDGIEELNTPLPRWWLMVFLATIVFSLGYVIVYPAWPMLHSGTQGLWGWTSRGQLAQEIQAANAQRAPLLAKLAETPTEAIAADPQLLRQAKAGGAAVFKVNCAPCHGAAAAGSPGYPNLNDDDWLWGGTVKDIETTITHGIRAPGDPATHASLMPSFGKDGILKPDQVADVTSYVRTLSGAEPADAASARGQAVYAANCVVCHGADGKGNRAVGAPNLADKVWLYGGSREAIAASIAVAHAGVMPAWGGKLDPATIKMLAVYVHSLGGGEKMVASPGAAPAAPAPAAPAPAAAH